MPIPSSPGAGPGSLSCDWDVDPAALGVCPDWAGYPEATRDTALHLASDYLWAATGRQYGVCPVTVQPRQGRGGTDDGYRVYPAWPGGGDGAGYVPGPFLFGGKWFNSGCDSCCNSGGCAIVLRGPVASIDEVVIDGEVVSPANYRVDVTAGEYLLVRTGPEGSCWPSCGSEPDDFSVTYGIGRALPVSLQVAAALLACEYAKGIAGGPCKLPARMTRLSRQGVDIEVEAVDGAAGSTGIREVDDVIAMLNPTKRLYPPVLLSPDLAGNCDRVTVWP